MFGPGMMLVWEKFAPSYVGKGGFAPIMRLSGVIGVGAGFFYFYNRSIRKRLSLLVYLDIDANYRVFS